MALWLDETGLLTDDNGVIECDDCPCVEADTTTGTDTECAWCPSAPSAFELTVSGITNGIFGCTNCPSLNGTKVLTYNPDLSQSLGCIRCGWTSPSDLFCAGTTNVQYVLNILGSGSATLRIVPGPGCNPLQDGDSARYVLAGGAGTFDCFGTNVFNRVGSATATSCTNYPATITVTPHVGP